jgi:hypothetical protein
VSTVAFEPKAVVPVCKSQEFRAIRAALILKAFFGAKVWCRNFRTRPASFGFIGRTKPGVANSLHAS